MTAQTAAIANLSERLRTEAAERHESMHQLMARLDPFASRAAYASFVAAQYGFQRDVEHLFSDPAVQVAVPDLDVRGRKDASLADLTDLGRLAPSTPIATAGVTVPAALGWLYVSEGSTLGAAFLLKEAQDKLGLSEVFGARNLAAYPGGRAIVWRRFVASLDAGGYAPAAQDVVIAGAHTAFDRFAHLLEQAFIMHARA